MSITGGYSFTGRNGRVPAMDPITDRLHTDMDRSLAAVAIILSELAKTGIKMRPIRYEDFDLEGLDLDESTFYEVLIWMRGENLVRFQAEYLDILRNKCCPQVQLTSSGIDIAQHKIPILGKSIVEAANSDETLAPSAFAKAGAFIGGLLAGAAKTLG